MSQPSGSGSVSSGRDVRRHSAGTGRNLAAFGAAVVLSVAGACGSAGDEVFSLSTHELTFTAADTCALLPAQAVSATVTSGGQGRTLYIKVVSVGPAVASVSNFTITGNGTGQALVYPASALTLGTGTFTSTITVWACTTGPDCSSGQLPGSPQTVNVRYDVGPPGVQDDPSRYTITRWETRTTDAPFLDDFRLANLGDTLYVVALGFYSHVVETWRSTDGGARWAQVASGPTRAVKDFALASDAAAIYLSGGVDVSGVDSNEVWKFDGASWTLKAASPGFAARNNHAMVKHGDRLYVLGGRSGATPLGDVWSSSDDGQTWTALATAAFTPRFGLCALALTDSLYVIGGVALEGEIIGFADVWRSMDGAAWNSLDVSGTSTLKAATYQQGGRCAAVGDRLYYIGRNENTRCRAASVSSLDGINWQFEPSAYASSSPSAGAAVIGGQIYLASGAGTSQRYVARSVP